MLDRGIMSGEAERLVPIDVSSISQLFLNSLALSALKSFAGSTWALRVNPSSGNLHPTEGYLITGPVDGLAQSPGVFHYAPNEHVLELRFKMNRDEWNNLGLPKGTLLVVLSSIYLRKSGHALGAIGTAASCLGWTIALHDEVGTEDLYSLLGMSDVKYLGAEHPNCLLAIFTDGVIHDVSLSSEAMRAFHSASFQGKPNVLSMDQEDWPIINNVSVATSKPARMDIYEKKAVFGEQDASRELCKVIRKRRSAQAMNGRTMMSSDEFYDILRLTLPIRPPLSLFPWKPHVDLVLFTHRVQGLESGLYLLVRDEDWIDELRDLMAADFAWERDENGPKDLELYLLAQRDLRALSQQASCHQEIVSDGCFAVAMLAEFEKPIKEIGPWFYNRLYWECGVIGQLLYLGAEAFGYRECGIGCFFDDFVHKMLSLMGLEFQDLYHFTVGKALEDKRLITLPPYSL